MGRTHSEAIQLFRTTPTFAGQRDSDDWESLTEEFLACRRSTGSTRTMGNTSCGKTSVKDDTVG
ncbi:hypothetical protein Cantr_00384 [Candida viswanathii]|uniref:Uncharacterized protein n=1 Tax=Candida viswanathii TaxID=5486 RepID=A0A367YFI1_9ASCO|nr:hypothetical protein Cantr_00384 [Candida viswanathii]